MGVRRGGLGIEFTSSIVQMRPFSFQEPLAMFLDCVKDCIGTEPRYMRHQQSRQGSEEIETPV